KVLSAVSRACAPADLISRTQASWLPGTPGEGRVGAPARRTVATSRIMRGRLIPVDAGRGHHVRATQIGRVAGRVPFRSSYGGTMTRRGFVPMLGAAFLLAACPGGGGEGPDLLHRSWHVGFSSSTDNL